MVNNHKHTFYILHGSWQGSEGWAEVQKLLLQQGHTVELLELPGHGADTETEYHKINLNTYVNYVCKKIQTLSAQSVILVGHSMSGMVISQVAENIPVDKLIYVSAFLPVNGESLMDLAKRSSIIGISKNMLIDRRAKSILLEKNGLDKLFYNDCTPETIELALSRLQVEPLLPFYGSVRLTSDKFGAIPKTYIECSKDFSISLELQRFMHNRWPCQVLTLDSGHAPFYSMPELLAKSLIQSVD